MPSAPGHILPLEFDQRASSNIPPFIDPSPSAEDQCIGWRRQVSSSTSNEDTPSIASSFTSSGTRSEFWTNSRSLQTSSRTAARTAPLSIEDWIPTRTNSFVGPSNTTSPSDTGTRTTEISGLPIPSLATESGFSPTAGQGSSFEPLPFGWTSRSYISRPSPVSQIPSSTSAVPPSYSSLRPPLPLYTDPSVSLSFILPTSTPSFLTTLTTFLPITSTIWMSPSITTTTTVTPPSPTSGTSAEVAPTDTLIPEGGGHGNVFVSNKGALAGLILGCIAFAGLVAAMGLFAYRRHRTRSAHNADAVTALRRGPDRLRAHMLDDDDDNRGHMGGMAFLGAHPVSRQSGGAPYAPLRSDNALEGAAGEGNVGRQDVSGSGVVALPPIPILRGLAEEMEDAVLMHPARRSNHYVAAAGVGNGSSPRSQALPFVGNSPSGTGTGSAVWLGGPVVSSPETSTTSYFDRAAAHSLPGRSMSPSSVYSDDVMSAHPDSHSIVGVIGRYVGHEQLPYGGQDSYASSSMYRHGGAGSSSGGHGSLNDDKIGGSLSGDVPSTTTHSSHVLLSRPTPVSTPSSLLPTKTAPPTPYRNDGKRGFIGRSLRSLRFRSAPTGLSLATTAGAYSSAGPDSAPKRQALHDPLSSQHASTIHPQPPTLSPIPRPLLRSKHSMPERAAPYRTPECGPFSLGAPVWPSISVVPCRSGAPSPALTEGSSRTPDGLLNPRLVNSDGMQSRGALSFRDDMDYSRSIGGLVNNRQCSSTSLETMSSATLDRPRSLESDKTDRVRTQAVPVSPEEENMAPPRYEDLSWPAPFMAVPPPCASAR